MATAKKKAAPRATVAKKKARPRATAAKKKAAPRAAVKKKVGRSPAWPFDPRLEELVVITRSMVARVKKPAAVGGALAMTAHGYRRHTDDVDLFARSEDRLEWLRAARAEGLSISTLYEGVHYAAYLPRHGSFEVRIDLLFPYADPDISAIEDRTVGMIGGHRLPIWKPKYLGAAKFMSDRTKDTADFEAMMELGILDPSEIHFILGHVEPDSAPRFTQYMIKIRSRRPGPSGALSGKVRGRLPRSE